MTRQTLILAHRIDTGSNVRRFRSAVPIDFAAPIQVPPRPTRSKAAVDIAGGAFVLAVLVCATLALFFLPGAH